MTTTIPARDVDRGLELANELWRTVHKESRLESVALVAAAALLTMLANGNGAEQTIEDYLDAARDIGAHIQTRLIQ